MAGDLKITAEQKTKLIEASKAMQEERTTKLAEARQSGDRQKMQEVQQELAKKQHDSLYAVLTDAQKKDLEKYLKDHPQPRFGGGGNRRPPGGAGAGGNPPPPPAR